MIRSAALVVRLFDYLSNQNDDEAIDLMKCINNEVESNESKPADYGIKPLIDNQTDPEDLTNGN